MSALLGDSHSKAPGPARPTCHPQVICRWRERSEAGALGGLCLQPCGGVWDAHTRGLCGFNDTARDVHE